MSWTNDTITLHRHAQNTQDAILNCFAPRNIIPQEAEKAEDHLSHGVLSAQSRMHQLHVKHKSSCNSSGLCLSMPPVITIVGSDE
jgi:hypothetical protein